MIEVSVVIAVHNGARYLGQAIDSVLGQTFPDFEVVVVDDGSTDETASILNRYRDPRMIIVRNPRNLGLTGSLNRGLSVAKGAFIARMDGDDISLPNRFSEQIAFLKSHPDVGILGSGYTMIDQQGRVTRGREMPKTDLEIRWASFLENPFCHPTVMIRRSVLAQNGLNYDETFRTAQDYDLWCRVLRYTKGANLEKRLVYYRLSEGLTMRHRQAQLKNHDIISHRTIEKHLPALHMTPQDVGHLRELFAMQDENRPGVSNRRVVLAHMLLDMFEAFIYPYTETVGVKTLKRSIVEKVAMTVFHRPLEPGWMGVLMRLMKLEPITPLLHCAGWAKRRGYHLS